MKQEKAILKQKLIEFQKTIAGLNLALKEQQRESDTRDKELITGILEVMDAFEALDAKIDQKQADVDKSTQRIFKSFRSIGKKLQRLLKSRDIVPMDLSENCAQMDQCRIVETRKDPERQNQEIVMVIRNGYVNRKTGEVIRKAEVITVNNDD